MRKLNKKYIVLIASIATLFSCAELDYEVESGIRIEKPVSVIVDEKVSSYDVLKSYAGDLVLGANASLNDMDGTSPMTTLLVSNFSQVTPKTELQSNVIISDDGLYDFSSIDNYLSNAEERGLSVFGDAIVSNLNQNDTYLNSLIAPYTFLTPLYPNIIIPGPIYSGSFTGWNVKGNITVEDYLGHPSVKMVNSASVGASDATSIQSPVYTVDEGAKFEMTFYLLSNQAGEGRVIFTGLNNNEPELDWMGKGRPGATFVTKIGWNKIQFQTDDFDDSGEFSFRIELGYTPNVTYFMNIQGLSVININGSVDNPDEIFLECEDAQQIGQWMITETGDDTQISGGKTLVGIINGDITADDVSVGNPSDVANQDLQFTYTFNVRTSGTYRLWIRQKAHVADNGYDSFFMSVDGVDYYYPPWPGWGDDTNTTTWTWFKLYTDNSDIDGSSLFYLEAGEHTVSIKIREGGHYFDRMYLTMTSNIPTGFGSSVIAQKEVTLEVSDEEKTTAIEAVLNEYIENVLTNLNDRISAWTVVQQPFAEDGNVAVSGGTNVNGTFYWADYIGSDYIAQAFSVAKESAASGIKLFISETDLNTNANKLSAVINSVNNITEIDGIAVSLDLDLDSDIDAVGNMLDDLAATGKLIYITNLSVKVSALTDESDALASEIYNSVVDLYKTKVPASQQYGISLYTVVDIDLDDSLFDYDYAGLWDSGYNRKQGYAGFVTGIGAKE